MAFSYHITNHTDGETFDVEELVNNLAKEVLGDVDVSPCFIEQIDDDDGQKALMVTLCYNDPADVVSGRALNLLTFKMRNSLLEQGIADYPYFQHQILQGQKASA